MQHAQVGSSGLVVSSLGLGTLTWGGRTAADEAMMMAHRFVEAGGSLVDTSASFGRGAAEEILADALEQLGRDRLTVCTKAGTVGSGATRVLDTSRHTLMSGLNESLRRLRTDYVDLWLVAGWSAVTPLEETLSALEWAWRSGRARYIGVTSYRGWQLARAVGVAKELGIPLVAHNVEYSLLDRGPEHEALEAADALGVGTMARAPLGRGLLSGRYRDTMPSDARGASPDFAGYVSVHSRDDTPAIMEALSTAAKGLGTTPLALALAWVTAHSSITSSIIGPRNDRQLAELLEHSSVVVPDEINQALAEVSVGSLLA